MLTIMFISVCFRVSAVMEMRLLMIVCTGWFRHGCVHLDTESPEHR